MKSDSTGAADLLSSLSTDIRNNLALLKQRQDQLFHKQDQIQSTLAGETPVSNSCGFRSPSGSSVLAWSSVPIHTPMPKLPSHTPMMERSFQHDIVIPPQSTVVHAQESSNYLYKFSSLLDEEPYQSSLSNARSDQEHIEPRSGEGACNSAYCPYIRRNSNMADGTLK